MLIPTISTQIRLLRLLGPSFRHSSVHLAPAMMLYGFVTSADTKYAAAIQPTDGYGHGAPVIVPTLAVSALVSAKAARA